MRKVFAKLVAAVREHPVAIAVAASLSAVIAAPVASFAAYQTPDYSGLTAEAGNQLSSAPTLVASLAGPIFFVVMTIVGVTLAIKLVRRAAR